MALSEVRITHSDSVPVAVVRRQARASELSKIVPESCGVVWSWLRARQLRGGRHVAIYWDGVIRLEVGVEMIEPIPDGGDVVDLYKNTMIGMVAVFQIPTLVFFLARIRMVTARFMWRHIKYAVLVIFIAAAVLTPSPDPWNQAVFAAPMLGLYVVSIGIAWLVAPRRPGEPADRVGSPELKLVFVAAVIDHARRRDLAAGDFPRLAR